MKNLEQLRALAANQFYKANESKLKSQKDGEVIAKIPGMIHTHGLLATLAYAKAKGEGWKTYLQAIGQYLATPAPDGPSSLPLAEGQSAQSLTLDQFISILTSHDSNVLRIATREAKAYLGYLKRFAPTDSKSQAVPAAPQAIEESIAPNSNS